MRLKKSVHLEKVRQGFSWMARIDTITLMERMPQTRTCFCCGVENPLGLALAIDGSPSRVETRFVFKELHVGFPNVVHGGLISTVLDEIMAWGCGTATGRFAYCAELTVRFLAPCAPGRPVVAIGTVTENRRGRIFECRGELRDDDGKLLAEGSGKYIPLPREQQEQLRGEFVTAPGPFLASLINPQTQTH